jgi:trypsin
MCTRNATTRIRRAAALVACTSAFLAVPAGSALAIVNGQEVGIDRAPWQAAVFAPSSQCGGAIIDANRILTSAHCVDEGVAPSAVQVFVGLSSVATQPPPSQAVPVSAIRLHPYYRPLPNDHDDIAILDLARPLPLGSSTVQAIPLAPAGPKLPAGAPLTLTGYGHTQSVPARGAGPLRLATTVVNGPEQCSVGFENANAVWLCTPSAAEFGKTCPGDSGSPVTTVLPGEPTPVLVGIVSGAAHDDCTQAFGGSADVTAPEIRAFIDGAPAPPVAPRLKIDHEAVDLNDADRAGERLTCKAPQVDNATITYVFAHQPDDADRTRVIPRTPVQSGRSSSRALTAQDAGKRMVCIVVATNAGGTSSWASDDDSDLRDTIQRARSRPTVSIRRATCRRRTCSVSFTIRERGSVAGPSKVTARIGRRGMRVRALGRDRYRATGRKPRGRRLRVRISAVSAASNRRSRTASRTVRVR